MINLKKSLMLSRGISSYESLTPFRIGEMHNFNNVGDAALSAWELQQVTKPDGGGWNYVPDTTSPIAPYGTITDHFFSNQGEITWPADRKDILARIIPSRAQALGAVDVPLASGFKSNLNMRTTAGFQYSDNNYDHSAQFLSTYQKRKKYWETLLEKMRLN